MSQPKDITVRYVGVDGFTQTKVYKTFVGAQRFAHQWVGSTPEIGSTYALATDGVGKIEVSGGATLRDIFPGVINPLRTDRPLEVFQSKGGRKFTLGQPQHDPPRFLGDPLWHDLWPIFMDGKEVGSLWRSNSYGPDKPWSVTLRQVCWMGKLPPTGIGFDSSAHPTAMAALQAFTRNTDEVLDWREGKAVRSIYSKTGTWQIGVNS